MNIPGQTPESHPNGGMPACVGDAPVAAMNRLPNDAGVFVPGLLLGGVLRRPGRTLAGLVLAGVAVHGAWQGLDRLIVDSTAQVKVHTEVEVKHGEVTDTFALDQTCIGGYSSDVSTKSQVDLDLPGIFVGPLDPSIITTYTGNMTNIICPQSKTLERHTNNDAPKGTPRVTLTADPTTWETFVYPTNPIDPKAYGQVANIGGTLDSNFEETLKSVLFTVGLNNDPSASGADILRTYGRDVARWAAADYVTKACANPAWVTLKAQVAAGLKEKAVKEYNTYNPGSPITMTDVAVDLPDTIVLDDQYTKAKDELLTKGNTSSMKLTFAMQEPLPVCKPLPTKAVEKGPEGAPKL
jgi:hypothetical protein